MIKRAQSEDGVAMIITVLILFVLLAFGAALLSTSVAQKRSGFNQQTDEGAFSLAEAALNAQVYELSLKWPTASDGPQTTKSTNYGWPSSCTAASNGATYCPSASDFSTAYPVSSQTCRSGQGDAWSSSAPTNGWTTYVRDAGSGQSYFSSSAEKAALPFDASRSKYLWVRAVGTVDCHTAVVVQKVSEQILSVPVPNVVLDANGFDITDSGNKIILNTQGTAPQSTQINVRCNGLQPPSTSPQSSNCTQFSKSSQITTSPPNYGPGYSATTLNASQLQQIQTMAAANGTYFGPGVCPSSMSQLTGNPTYVDGTGCGTIHIADNSDANSASSPGYLVIANANIEFDGGGTFYGMIYDANLQNSSGVVVSISGTTTIVGGVIVDGNGIVALGSSGNGVDCSPSKKCGDLMYGPNPGGGMQSFGGAAGTPNTFRQLPLTQ